jgi:hypothetical protein
MRKERENSISNGGIEVARVSLHFPRAPLACILRLESFDERIEFLVGDTILPLGIATICGDYFNRSQCDDLIAAENADVFAGGSPLEPMGKIGPGFGGR